MCDKIVFTLDDLEVIDSVGPVDLTLLKERTQAHRRQQELLDEIRQLYAVDLRANTDQQFAEYRKLAGRLLLLDDQIRIQLAHSNQSH